MNSPTPALIAIGETMALVTPRDATPLVELLALLGRRA